MVVHLPIGILLLAGFFQLFSKKYPPLRAAVPAIVFWGMTGAVLSCITGYLLSLSGDYDRQLTGRHQWMGIGTTLIALLFYFVVRKERPARLANGFALASISFVAITGHLGGSLTHGSSYLTEALTGGENPGLKPIPDIPEAVLYTDIVQPILKNKCYSCHGPSRQKGKLRLDEGEHLLKGGEAGPAVTPGNADDSELIQRLLLPLSNEEHMPPKEKPQLTGNEVALLHWWVSTGADFTKKIKELEQPEKIRTILAALQTGETETESSEIPEETVPKADEKAVQALRNAGVVVLPVATDNPYLMVSFLTAGEKADTLVKLLAPLQKQLVWLRLDDTPLGDDAMVLIAGLSNLTRLSLSHTRITDTGVAKLQSLKNLQVLNLVNTPVTENGLLALKDLQKLRAVYLYQTRVDKTRWQELRTAFPKTTLDSGGYIVPTLPSDTTLVTNEAK